MSETVVTKPAPRHRRNVPVDASSESESDTVTAPASEASAEATANPPDTADTAHRVPLTSEGADRKDRAHDGAASTPAATLAPAEGVGTAPTDARGPGAQGPAADGPAANKWWTLVAVCLGTFMLLLDVTIVNVALPDIQTALGTSFSGLQWVVDAYALSLAALLLTAGSLADIFGRRRLYVIGLVVFTLASVLCGAAQDTLLLQLSRALQGVGGAVMFAVSLALLADAFRGKDRGVAFGVWGAITGLAVAIGPLLGGLLVSGLSWRWIFFVNVPVGIVAVVIALTRVAESRNPHARRPDWAGFALFTVALSSLVYGLIESNQRSFSSSLVIGCLVVAVALLAVFVVVELRIDHPMFELSLFKLPTFTGGAVAAFGLSSTIFAMLLYLVLYLQDVLRYDALGTGVRLLFISAGIVATSAVSGRLSAHVPVRLLIGPGLLLVGVGLLLMRGLDADSTWTHLIPGFLVGGLGIGLVNPPLASTAVGVVTPQRAGMASGISSTFRQVGIATGIALLGSLFTSRVHSDVLSRVAGVPSLSGQGPKIATAVQSGDVGSLLARLPAASRGPVTEITRAAFTAGMDRILLVAAIVALAAGVVALVAIRGKDFVRNAPARPPSDQQGAGPARPATATATATATAQGSVQGSVQPAHRRPVPQQ